MSNLYRAMMAMTSNGWNAAISAAYRDLSQSQYRDPGALKELQLGKLKKLIVHAYEHTAFYKKRLDQIRLNPYRLNSFEEFKRIPPLTREDLNGSLESMIAQNIDKTELHFDSTGGSTGLATQFARNNGCLGIKKASEYRFNNFAGWSPGEKILYYWPALMDFSAQQKPPVVLKKKLFSRQLALHAGRLNDRILSDHVAYFSKFKPDLVRAFPNSLQIFAEYVLDRKLEFKVKRGVICVGEPLNDYQRQLFRRVFNCDTLNCYVSRECGNIACECENHSGLHVADELLYLEIGNDKEGEIGELIITDLENYGMPLIRYRIQDASKWAKGKCACGRNLMKIDLNAARLTDYLISPHDGAKISGSTLVHYLLAVGPRVGRFKLIQDKADHLLIQMTENFEKNKNGIDHARTTIDRIFKGAMKIDIEFVEDLPFLESGKYRFVERTFD
jgi:phenylacetate-CoA ligase